MNASSSSQYVRHTGVALALVASVVVPPLWIDNARLARSTTVIAAYLVLALTEIVPPFVPALFLLVTTPLALGAFAPEYRLGEVLKWPADPVLALFAGGLALGLAARVHGVDRAIAGTVLRVAHGRQRALLGLVLAGTALMSMWMSNIAAAAMVLAALRPVLRQGTVNDAFRSALLLGVAVGATSAGWARRSAAAQMRWPSPQRKARTPSPSCTGWASRSRSSPGCCCSALS